MGSSDAAAAAGSSITVTSNMTPPSHRQLFSSRGMLLSGVWGTQRPECAVVVAGGDGGDGTPSPLRPSAQRSGWKPYAKLYLPSSGSPSPLSHSS
ncbi:hypothetical protein GCM10010449_75350 [Streptomyces rectiviolaceus]|uniref:Uncharacterized protein n=1 Tax=Streptomyces rectiviolaceus TaxID=332591 RepID=A0ABP6NDT4_9ACTN